MCKVSVIIPNYNGKHYMKACLDALFCQSFTDFEVLVVDNGSKDGSVEYLEREYPKVRILPLLENTGFCGAVNAGIRHTDSPYVLLLNNDTIPEKDFVKELVNSLEENEKRFSCQAKMLKIQDASLADDTGNFYSALGWAYGRGKDKPEKKYNIPGPIFASCAGAAIYRRNLLEKTGLFDEEHFAYLEDIDLGYRARIQGFVNWYCPKARVLHVGSGTSGSRYNLFKVRYSSRNNVYMIYKNMPAGQIILNLPFFMVGFGVKTLFFAIKGYGKEYLAGIKNGFCLAKKSENKSKKVQFQWRNMKNYAKIQLELWANCIKRVL